MFSPLCKKLPQRLGYALLAAGLMAAPWATQAHMPPPDGAKPHATPGPNVPRNKPGQVLPYADGRTFRSLNDYLAYRKTLGRLDRPYYEEISPGLYRLVAMRRPNTPDQVFTRQQLLDLFGFRN